MCVRDKARDNKANKQGLMALEAILKVALVKSVEVRRRISKITRQTSPSTRENARRGEVNNDEK